MADSQPYHSHNDAAVRDDDDAADGGGAGGIVDHDSIHIHSLHAERDPSNPSAESLSPGSHEGWLTKRGWKLGCVPVWKRRWFILKGQYIFKFESPTSSRPKGVPIPVLGATCGPLVVDPSSSAVANGHGVTMVLSTLRKEYVLGAENERQMNEWIEAIIRARAISVKQELGHAPITSGEEFANRSGALLIQKRLERETDEVEHSRNRFGYQP